MFPCNDNTDVKRNNIIFTIKDTKLFFLELTLSAKVDHYAIGYLLDHEYSESNYRLIASLLEHT